MRELRLIIFIIAVATIAQAQTLPRGVSAGPALAGINEYHYPNGLKVLLLPDPGSSSIFVNVTYLVGSRHEGYGESGMAHLLEHMLFIKSTNGRDIKQEIIDHGASWNGTTSRDRTNYFETFKPTDGNLRWALDMEAERMVNIRIEKELLDTEMTVVRNEFENTENNPAGVLNQRVWSTAFLWHNYGKSVIGSRADIEKVPAERLLAFYKKFYQPDNAVVTIAGKIDSANALALVASTLGAIPRPTRKLDETYTVEPVQDGERFVELRRVGNGKNLMIVWHTPAISNPDLAALQVLNGVLSGGGIGRLDKRLVDTKKAVGVGMGSAQLHDPGLTTFSASLSDEQSVDEVKKIALETISGILKEAPSQEELDRTKLRLTQGMERTMANSDQLAFALNEMIAYGDWRLFFTQYEGVKRVTADDVVRVAKTYLKDSNRTIGQFIPEANPDRAIVPDGLSITELMNKFKPNVEIANGEAIDPSPLTIERRVHRSTLSSGFPLVLLPKESRDNRVQARLALRFGDEKSLAGQAAVPQIMGALFMRGTKTKTREQIQDALQKLNATVGFGGGLGGTNANITTTAENLRAVLELAVEILREPAFPESDFDEIRKQAIAAAERSRPEPGTLANLALNTHLNPYPRSDVRHVRTIDEQIEDLKKVTIAEIRNFHQKFLGASNGFLTVVGKFDENAVKQTAERLLASWKSASPFARVVTPHQDVKAINTKIETPDKANANFLAAQPIRMTDADPDYPALVMAIYMFGGELSSRMPDRIRNREGLSYGAGAGFGAPSPVFGENATFSMSAISNPKNTPRVEASAMDELRKTLREGFTEAELQAKKKSYLDQNAVFRSTDGDILGTLSPRQNVGRTLQWDADFEAKLQALTLDQVNAAFRKYIKPEEISIVKGGDFKAADAYQ